MYDFGFQYSIGGYSCICNTFCCRVFYFILLTYNKHNIVCVLDSYLSMF